jgi:hypothetical protein
MWAIVPLLLQHMFAFCSSSKLTIPRAFVAKFIGTCQTSQSPVTQAPLCSLQRITSTKWSTTSHLKSVNACLWDIAFLFKHINHTSPEMIYQALHQGLQHPLKRIFPGATIIEYFNVITSSPLFQESTHPGVASALCSTLGTTPYFFVSLPLSVSRVQVALYL